VLEKKDHRLFFSRFMQFGTQASITILISAKIAPTSLEGNAATALTEVNCARARFART